MQTRSSKFMSSRRWVLGALAALTFLPLMAGTAAADPLDGPRNAGTVGESYTGYAVVRDGASSADAALVQSINDQRKAFYEQKAAEQGVSVSAIQEIYAQAIFDRAPSGWWFQTQGGWSQK